MISENENSKFQFHAFDNFKFQGYQSKEFQELLYKWGMKDNMTVLKFGYDQFLRPFQMESFLVDFFNDASVQSVLKIKGGKLGHVSKVSFAELAHDVTSLSFFDKLKPHVVRNNGSIIKCLDEYYGSFVVSDLLRKALLMDDQEMYSTFSESDRKEFIFHVFKSLCLGGTCCQFEDELEPYLNATKSIYKDLVTVVKDTQSGKIKVASYVYQILQLETIASSLFPVDHPQNFCYVSIDPIKRHVNVLYHASESYY